MTGRTVGISYQQHTFREDWDAIVIGSGIGGLTVAALLARHGGKRVLVLERHYTAGGYTHAFHRPGYDWDVGVHYIGEVQTASSPMRPVFDNLTDGRLEWSPMPEIYDRVRIGDHEYDFVAGRERLREQLKSYFPGEAHAIDSYLQAVESCVRSRGRYYAEKALPRPIAILAGPLMKASFMRWARRTTADVLDEMGMSRDLKGLLTAQWVDYGMPPRKSSFAMHATVASHYLEGASYPVGGATSIAAGIAPMIESAGGQIVHSAEVREILLDSAQRARGVRMEDGREFRAGIVISDAGAWNTFSSLLPPETPGVSSALQELRGLPPSMAHLCLYVGVRGTAKELGFTGTNLLFHPTPDHDANLARFEKDPSAPFPLMYVSFPSAKDPDFERRHPGHATLEVITPAPYDWFVHWENTRWKRRGEDYNEFKQKLADRLRHELEEVVPTVRGRIEIAELSTPLTTRHFVNYPHGEIYGMSAGPERFRVRCLTARTAIHNLYLTGQDACMLSVVGATIGGILTASAVLGRNLMPVVTRPQALPARLAA
jgi:phytoene dehydrogenase-like protein